METSSHNSIQYWLSPYLVSKYRRKVLVGEVAERLKELLLQKAGEISSKLILSNGIKIDFEVHETLRLKQLQRKLARTQKGSRNRERIRVLLRKEYEKLNHRRKDAQSKVLAFLKIYRKVIFQDD